MEINIRSVPKSYDADWNSISSVSTVIPAENNGREVYFVFFVAEEKLFKSNYFSSEALAEELREELMDFLKSHKAKLFETLEKGKTNTTLVDFVVGLSSGTYSSIVRKAGPTPKNAVVFKSVSFFKESDTDAYLNESSWVLADSKIIV